MMAAILAAVFVWVLATLPPGPAPASGTVNDDVCRRTIAGAIHVHSVRSDGTGDVDEIATAASRAGLRFVVMTDHGDGTRPLDPPQYRHDVLIVDAVEISTNGGHYIALDMPQSPYRLGGEPDAVVEDVARLGGFGVVAHPDSSKPELAWRRWDAPVDAIEWLNLDSEWRDESRGGLARVVSHYFLRRGASIASLLDRPVETLRRWDAETSKRTVVAFGGHDAHGGLLEGGGAGPGSLFGIPSYEAGFRAFSVRAIVSRELTGRADEDARLVVEAMRHGRVFTSIDALAGPAFVDYRASAGREQASMGESMPFEQGARVDVHATLPEGGRIVLLHGGKEIAESSSDELSKTVSEPGAYRVEVRAPHAPGTPQVPWIVTNPIYLRGQATEYAKRDPEYDIVRDVPIDDPDAERDPASTGKISRREKGLGLDYSLAPGARGSQFVALSVAMPQPAGGADALLFDARSSAPMRISVQLRFDSLSGARWARSVYSSTSVSRLVVPFSKLLPVEPAVSAPSFPAASRILFVVDLINATPGQTGTFEISNLALARAR
jgi:hypothetical protein